MLIAHPVGTKTQFFPNHPKPRRPGKVNEIASSSGASLSRRLVVALSNHVHGSPHLIGCDFRLCLHEKETYID